MSFRPIYEPRTKAREYSDLAINIYKGCNHGCTYCFARKMAERYTSKNCVCSFNEPKPREGIVEAVRNQLSGGKYKGKKILLCFTCDPYPVEIGTTPTREIIKAIKDAGAYVSVLTKGGMRAARDFDLYKPGDSFGSTLTCFDEYHSKQWEPNAATPLNRLLALSTAHERGIKTWVSLEPVIYPSQTLKLIEESYAYVDLYKIGTINYSERKKEIDWKDFGQKAVKLLETLGKEYYIKDDLRKEMSI